MPRKICTWFSILVFAITSAPATPTLAQQTEPKPAPAPPQKPAVPEPTPAPQLDDQVPSGPAATPKPRPPSVPPAQPVPPRAQPERRMLPPPSTSAGGDMVSLNFSRADLVEVIHILAQHLRLTYTIDPEVKGTVTIHSAEPLRREDLLPVFHQVLRMNGAVAVRSGNVYRIAPIKDAKGLARPAGQNREDSFALQVVPVRFFSVAEMKKLLTPFLMPGGEIIEYPRGNFLIIMDLPSNIQRLTEIADLIDVQVFAGTRMEIYQPKIASAEELASELTKIMQSFASSAPQPETFTAEFVPIPRINQLLVISHSEAAWTYAKRWLERIDVAAEGPGRRIFIYPVENGKATELADVLNQALGLASGARRETPRTLQDLHRSMPGTTGLSTGTRSPTTPGTFAPPPSTSTFGAFAAVPAPAQPQQPGAAPAPVPTAPTPAAPAPARPPTAQPGAPTAKPEEQLRIVADPATNSLIVYGTAQEFQNIRNILKELDVQPRQVMLDVMVAEVTLTDDQSFGVEYEIQRKGGDVRIFDRQFGSRGGILSGLLSKLGAANASGITSFPAGVSGVIGTGEAVRALINALQSDSRAKVLSSPTVLATDNRPARIQVGTEEPIATGTVAAAVGGVAQSTSIQYRNTGRIVTIIPQVNSMGLVNLQILAEVSQRGASVLVGQDRFPSFDTRQAETTAVVQDGETLAIGGIIADDRTRSRTGVPYLMDIPIIGRFFGSSDETLRRTELIMLITPRVIRNREESKQATAELANTLLTLRNELARIRRERERDAEERERIRQSQKQQPNAQVPEAEKPAPAEPPPVKPTPNPSSGTNAEESAKGLGTNISSPVQSSPPTAGSDTGFLPKQPETSPAVGTPDAQEVKTEAQPMESAAVRSQPVSNLPSPPAVQNGGIEAKGPDDSKPLSPGIKTEVKPWVPPARKDAPSVPQGTNGKNSGAGAPVKSARAENAPEQIWFVQVSSHPTPQEAETVAESLRTKGYDAYVARATVNGKTWHRVHIGRFASEREASQLQKKLKTNENLDQSFVMTRY